MVPKYSEIIDERPPTHRQTHRHTPYTPFPLSPPFLFPVPDSLRPLAPPYKPSLAPHVLSLRLLLHRLHSASINNNYHKTRAVTHSRQLLVMVIHLIHEITKKKRMLFKITKTTAYKPKTAWARTLSTSLLGALEVRSACTYIHAQHVFAWLPLLPQPAGGRSM